MAADKFCRRFGTFFRFLQRITSRGSTVLNMAAVLRLHKMAADKIECVDTFRVFFQGGVGYNLTWLHIAKHGCRPEVTQDGGGI